MTNVSYVLLLNRVGDDFFSTSYTEEKLILHTGISTTAKSFTIFNFCDSYLGDYEYLAIGTTVGNHIDWFFNKRYLDFKYLEFFSIKSLDFDNDRDTMYIKAELCEALDIEKYKRYCKIRRIIES